MSDNPMLRWGFSHEQTPRTTTFYVKNRFKRRQRAKRLTEPVPSIPAVAEIADAEHSTSSRQRAGLERRESNQGALIEVVDVQRVS